MATCLGLLRSSDSNTRHTLVRQTLEAALPVPSESRTMFFGSKVVVSPACVALVAVLKSDMPNPSHRAGCNLSVKGFRSRFKKRIAAIDGGYSGRWLANGWRWRDARQGVPSGDMVERLCRRRLLGCPHGREELVHLDLQVPAFLGQRLRRREHLGRGASGVGGSAIDVRDV